MTHINVSLRVVRPERKTVCGYVGRPESSVPHKINAVSVFPLSKSSVDIRTKRTFISLLLPAITQNYIVQSKNRIPVRERQVVQPSLLVRYMFQQLLPRALVGTCPLLRLI